MLKIPTVVTGLLSLVLVAPLAATNTVTVPLTVDLPHLESLIAQELGLDATGRGRLSADRCNQLDLADLELAMVDRRLELSLGLNAYSGVEAFGRCRGPGAIASRLHLEMKPAIGPDGGAVIFRPDGAELRRPDGSSGLLSRPSRVLADSMIVPRLERVIVDISGLLAAVDSMIEEFMPPDAATAPRLSERGRLIAVDGEADGLHVQIAFAVRAAEVPAETTLHTEPPLLPEERLAWQRVEDDLDGFMTVLIARMAAQIEERDLQLDFLSLLLETRQRIAEALADDGSAGDPVRALFLNAWTGLRPLLNRVESMNVADDQDLRLAGFIAAGDALTALDALGPEFGLDISREGLRRLARLLLANDAPASFTPLPLIEDASLRRLFGLDPAGPSTGPQLPALNWWQQLMPLAHARSLPLAESLRGVVARPAILEEYLNLVAQLLDALHDDHISNGSRIPGEHRDMFQPLVRATAWRESCWRHYVGPVDEPRVIRSSVGAIGMMQIMGRVWRGIYDVDRLEAEIEYNIAAGIEILEHYLVDYALRRGEHQHPGGADNLIRATYAAYNGGPSHLGRHRREDTPARLRAIDDTFWEEFEQIRDEGWPPVSRCFSVTP